jgi:LysM repeat protein
MTDYLKSIKSKLPVILGGIGGIVIIGVIVLAVVAGATYYFFVYAPSLQPAADIPDLPPTAGPDVMFLEPASGTFALVDDSIQVIVFAQDIARVARLDLWVDDTLVISLPSPDQAGINPLILTYPLVAVKSGTYSLVARAYNMRGAMTESPAVTVFVSEVGYAAADADDQTALYVVKDGDTLQSIADKTGISPADIQAANSGIQNVNPGQNIAIPHPDLPKPPPAPAAPQGGNMGALPGLLPPALPPGTIQGSLPGIDPNQQALAPNLLPDPTTISDISAPPIKAPQLTQLIPTGCNVEVNWTDNSDNETGFAIYRRLVPSEPISKIVGTVPPDVETFVDKVPYPASYQYTVEALGPTIQLAQNQANVLNIQQAIDTARSNFGTADVQPDASCIAQPAMKNIFFKIDRLYVRDPSIIGAALWYSINNSAPRRIPSDQGAYPRPNGTGFIGKAYIPLPTSVYMNPDQHIIVKIWAAGHTDYSFSGHGIGPQDLGVIINSHPAADLQPDDGAYFQRFEFRNDEFFGDYLIGINDIVYGGSYSSTQLPAPTKLELVENSLHGTRKLEWDWTGDQNLLDGYVIYRSYSCFGQETEVRAPLVIGKKVTSYSLPSIYEPQGCTYKYQVTALGRLGESKPSNAVTGKTEDTFGVAYVTFKQVKITDLDTAQSGEFYFQAAQADIIDRHSTPMWLEKPDDHGYIIYPGEKMFLEGKSPNNTITLVLNPEYSMELTFKVSGLREGKTQPGSICSKGIDLEPSVWNQPNSTHTLKTDDGKCEAIVEITAVPPAVGASGQQALPQADLEIRKVAKIGTKNYVNIYNNGPQDLQSASIVVPNAWGGEVCPDDNLYEARITGQSNASFYTVDIKAGGSIWLYIGKIFDGAMGSIGYGANRSEGYCYNFADVGVYPTTTADNTTPNAYIETDRSNNRLRLPVVDIAPMQ